MYFYYNNTIEKMQEENVNIFLYLFSPHSSLSILAVHTHQKAATNSDGLMLPLDISHDIVQKLQCAAVR